MAVTTTWREALNRAALRLASGKAPGEDPAWDAWLLFAAAFGVDRAAFLLHETEEVDEDKLSRFNDMVEEAFRGRPVAYVLGSWEFMGLPFKVDERALIPRPDTEVLVESVIEWTKAHVCSQVLDLCTGTGCIAISLAHFLPQMQVEAVDISSDALQLAKENAALNQVSLTWLQGDLWDALPAGRRYDVITSNPPYIAPEEYKTLSVGIREFEPKIALVGGEDGLDFYRRLAARTAEFLNPGGRAFWEIGYNQGADVVKIAEDAGLKVVRVQQDLGDRDRVIILEI